MNQTNLPVQPTALVGRERELADVIELMRVHRLVTLTGAGGSGKTRLALQAAADLVDEFADGVWFVSLAALTDASLVEPTIASVVGAKEDLADFLRSKRMLLVLDNLEQLLPDGAAIVSRVPVNVIATSRARLNVYGEQEYHVPTLRLDEAVALFTERARLLKPAFEPDEHVKAIAQRLDGLPLALELAAARVKVLTPAQILERLDHSLDLLTGGPLDAPQRQFTLRATLEWSYDLLTVTEQRLFARLGVFAGSFDLRAAERVAEADLDALASLVDKSLVREAAEARFFMLATIREFAMDCLGALRDAEDVHWRHAKYFTETSEEIMGLPGATRATLDGLRELQRHDPNIRAALDWLPVDEGQELRARLCSAVGELWLVHDRLTEARSRFDEARRGMNVDDVTRARILRWAFWAAHRQGDGAAAAELAEETLKVAQDMGDVGAEADALSRLASVAEASGDLARAVALEEQGLELRRSIGVDIAVADHLLSLGLTLRNFGDLQRSEVLLTEALNLFESERDVEGVTLALINLGWQYAFTDRIDDAREVLGRALTEFSFASGPDSLGYLLIAAAGVAAAGNRDEDAARLLASAESIWGEADYVVEYPQLDKQRTWLERALVERLGSTAYSVIREEAASTSPEAAIDLALGCLD